MPHALVVDDDPSTLGALAELVEQEGFATSVAGTLEDARALAAQTPPDVVLTDLVLPDGRGLDLLEDLRARDADAEVIMITGHASVESAVDALRMGAADYLTKPLDVTRLRTILANIARTRELKDEIRTLRAELRGLGHFGPLLGGSPAMQAVYDLIGRVAATEATVLVTGESGTGKDLVAQTIHRLSGRRKEAFLPLNCGAVSPTLIESELFGHERGSFTGADRLHRGYFERADHGTLFLDEITEMPIELQVKLLRVLETGTVTRIGGERSLEVDVRVIASSNRPPDEAVAAGKLREDLFYRLKVFPIPLPRLRERGPDLDLLADHFLRALNEAAGTSKRFTAAALARLGSHAWPGNVRELKNVVHRAFILAEREIGADDLPAEVGAGPPAADLAATPGAAGTVATGTGSTPASSASLTVPIGTPIAEVDRRLILATLDQCGADKKKAAQILGISLKTLYNRLNSYRRSTGPKA